MTSKELNEIFNKTRRTQNISLTPEQVEELIKDLEIIDLLKKCYYASSINKNKALHITSYGFDNPQDVIKIGEWLDGKD